MRYQSFAFLGLLGAVLSGCSEALPKGDPKVQVTEAVARAEVAAEQAKKDAARAEAEAARSAQMLRDAREALARAKSAEEICRNLDARIPKNVKPKVIYIEKKVEEAPVAAASSPATGQPSAGTGAVAPSGAQPVAPEGSGYSKSDAPGGSYHRGGTAPSNSSTETAPHEGAAAVPKSESAHESAH